MSVLLPTAYMIPTNRCASPSPPLQVQFLLWGRWFPHGADCQQASGRHCVTALWKQCSHIIAQRLRACCCLCSSSQRSSSEGSPEVSAPPHPPRPAGIPSQPEFWAGNFSLTSLDSLLWGTKIAFLFSYFNWFLSPLPLKFSFFSSGITIWLKLPVLNLVLPVIRRMHLVLPRICIWK